MASDVNDHFMFKTMVIILLALFFVAFGQVIESLQAIDKDLRAIAKSDKKEDRR